MTYVLHTKDLFMNLKNSLTYLLTQIATGYKNNLQKMMNEIGLHSGQVFVLAALWQTDGQSQIDLVKSLGLSPPTVNKMIGSLEKNGFVKSRKCGGDGRVMRVHLTEKGIAVKTPVENQWLKLETESFANLTETEKLVLQQLFGKLKENLSRGVASQPKAL